MWSIEKFGAVSGRRQAAVLRPPIFLNRAGHPVFGEPFILSDFGAGPRPSYARLRRKCGKLDRQTPIYRNHSKSQKTNNCNLLKSPKNHILQRHELRACGMNVGTRIAGHRSRLTVNGSRPLATGHSLLATAFLTGSVSQTEIAVTYSKQRTAQILTGSRIARKRSSNQSKFSPKSVHGTPFEKRVSRLRAVSYTHLDVYKRQSP